MILKNDKAMTMTELIISIVAIIMFSTLIFSLFYYNVMENYKLTKETMAMIHMTEILENVGIESFENLNVGNYTDVGDNKYELSIEKLVPARAKDNYKVDIIITDEFSGLTNNEKIMKKVKVTLTYEINNKKYACSLERMKIKE